MIITKYLHTLQYIHIPMKTQKTVAFLVSLLLCSVVSAQAQWRHYASVNVSPYSNFFNKERDKVYLYNTSYDMTFFPFLSYKIERNDKIGMEVYYTAGRQNYYTPLHINDERLTYASSAMAGVSVHYKVYNSNPLQVNILMGLNYMQQTTNIEGRNINLGLQVGANVTVPIWKGLYANSNLRYNTIPWSKTQHTSQNIILELGIGYRFGGNKKSTKVQTLDTH
jgi:hypothetical protein